VSHENGPGDVLQLLTRRERDVVHLMSKGLSNQEIANELFIAAPTAKAHVHNILRKLGVKTRLQAVLLVANDAA
jgi:NarL family two-component system response regulator LiaR